jgi:hypothetical protein
MSRGVRLCLVGVLVLVALAGCGRYFFAQRDPWRKEAELACLKSGAVKESQVLVRAEPINGPGICGADYPLRVTALGEVSSAMGYSEELRPPGAVPGGRTSRQPSPTWPAQEPRYSNPYGSPPPRVSAPQTYDPQAGAPSRGAVQSAPLNAPMVLTPQSLDQQAAGIRNQPPMRAAPVAPAATPARRPSIYDAPPPDDEDDVADAPSRAPVRQTQPRPVYPHAQGVPLSPRGQYTGSVGPVEIKPAATLACPIVSALDQWIANSVQPSARRWFGQPVAEIRQISAYSCRGMNAQPGARISEHAFGNALDISSFVLADGRRITVKNGWRGTPEEQGFLRDIQGAACEQFTTVLAPGSNRFHYDHIHVDLMRRDSGRTICNPDAVSGEVVAQRAAQEKGYALQSHPGVTGSIGKMKAADSRPRPKTKPKLKKFFAPEADDDDWVEDDGPRGRED